MSANIRPFEWTASCVLYAVVIALLLSTRWKKRPSGNRMKISKLERIRTENKKKVKELRKQISITKKNVVEEVAVIHRGEVQ